MLALEFAELEPGLELLELGVAAPELEELELDGLELLVLLLDDELLELELDELELDELLLEDEELGLGGVGKETLVLDELDDVDSQPATITVRQSNPVGISPEDIVSFFIFLLLPCIAVCFYYPLP